MSRHQVKVSHQQDAKKQTITEAQAASVLPGVTQVYSTKGKKVMEAQVGEAGLSGASLKDLLIGPSGNLRAPTIRVGGVMIVGFDEVTYARCLGVG